MRFSFGTGPAAGYFLIGSVLSLVAVVAGFAQGAAAQEIDCHVYVRQSVASVDGDGRKWDTAFGTLHEALEAVRRPSVATNVCIGAGIYHPHESFDLRDNVHLYGGFGGFEPSRYDLRDRDPAVHETILDGRGRSDHVLKCGGSHCAGPITLDGLTVRGGAAGAGAGGALSGGGLYNAIGEIHLADVVFADNEAAHQGGAIFNVAGTLHLSNVVLEGNAAASEGGGLYNHAGKLYMSNAVFVDNVSALGGAGVYTLGATEISNAVFLGNAAPYGSAAVGGHWFVLTNSIVWSNRAARGPQIFVNPALAKVAYSIVEDNPSADNVAYVGHSNIGENPLFVDVSNPAGPDGRWGTADDGLMPSENSPAIDAGTQDGVTPVDRDLIGNPRIRGASIDTGPYEYDPSGATITGVSDDSVVDGFALHQNYPNPFNPNTQIAFTLPSAAHVRLVIYDLLGHEVRVLVDGTLPAGLHETGFDASLLPSGVYAYALEAGSRLHQRRMVLSK